MSAVPVTLLPCPFCGGEAEYHTDKGITGELYGWVGCNQCDATSCQIDVRSMQPEETHPLDAWNARATSCAERDRALAGAVEALEKGHALIEDMSRFVGAMSLRDYANFNEAPIAMSQALAALRALAPDAA